MPSCTYCHRPAIQPQHILPPLCARHHQIVILLSRARRQHLALTPANLTALLRQAGDRFTLLAADIPALLRDVTLREAHQ